MRADDLEQSAGVRGSDVTPRTVSVVVATVSSARNKLCRVVQQGVASRVKPNAPAKLAPVTTKLGDGKERPDPSESVAPNWE